MGIRRQAREVALQMLYMCDCLHQSDEVTISFGLDHFAVDAEVRPYALKLVTGVFAHLLEIDEKISCASEHWSVSRMNRIDRGLLRLATFEISYCQDVPASVSINEAIEVSKRFGSKDSPMFVNGVLDKVAALRRLQLEIVSDSEKPAESAQQEHVAEVPSLELDEKV